MIDKREDAGADRQVLPGEVWSEQTNPAFGVAMEDGHPVAYVCLHGQWLHALHNSALAFSVWGEAMKARAEEAESDRGKLAKAIFDAAVRVGICRPDVEGLSGPQLLLLLQDVVGLVVQLRAAAALVQSATINQEELDELGAARADVPQGEWYRDQYEILGVPADGQAALPLVDIIATADTPEIARYVVSACNAAPKLVAAIAEAKAERDVQRARAERAEGQLAAIDSLSEEVWEDGKAAICVSKIRNGEPLDGLPTQEEYEARYAKGTGDSAVSVPDVSRVEALCDRCTAGDCDRCRGIWRHFPSMERRRCSHVHDSQADAKTGAQPAPCLSTPAARPAPSSAPSATEEGAAKGLTPSGDDYEV